MIGGLAARRLASAASAAALVVVGAACSTVRNEAAATDGSSGGSGAASSTSTTSTTGAPGGGDGGLGFGGDIGGPTSCETSCTNGSYCSHSGLSGDCGEGNGASGECVPVPPECADPGSLGAFCGCDGKIYVTVCAAYAAGVDVGSGCTAAPGQFGCGYLFCNVGEEACAIDVVYASAQCIPLPDSCKPGTGPAPDCSCWMPLPCNACEQDAAGNFVLDCPSND